MPPENFADLAKKVADEWHDYAPPYANSMLGQGHDIFAAAVCKAEEALSPVEDKYGFFHSLEALAEPCAVEEDKPFVYSGLQDKAGGIVAASQLLAEGHSTSVELTQQALTRLKDVTETTNACIQFRWDYALHSAEESERRRAAGRTRGVLDGIPLAHKGIYHDSATGLSDGAAEPMFFESVENATVLQRFAKSGAVNIGVLNLSESSFTPTGLNAHLGDCLNPWDTRSVPGGSSSGSAVACATSAVFGALGSDTGGSIRIPASLCGVTGLKPTYGRVSRSGVFPVSPLLDHVGPLARSAEDCAILFEAIAGHDPSDPTTSRRPVEPVARADLQGARIGVPESYFRERLKGDMAQTFDRAIADLREAGAEIVDVPDADYSTMNSLASMLIRAEVTAVHLPMLRKAPGRYSPDLGAMLMQGIGIPYVAVDHAQRLRSHFLGVVVEHVMADVDMLVTPCCAEPTPTIEQSRPGTVSGKRAAAALTDLMRLFNYIGLPCLSLPCGFHKGASGARMPQGMQLVGRPFSEARLLAAGMAYQSVTKWHLERPPL